MNATLRNVLGAAGLVMTAHAAAEVTFYERDGFGGRSFTTDRQIGNFERYGFNTAVGSGQVGSGPCCACGDFHWRSLAGQHGPDPIHRIGSAPG